MDDPGIPILLKRRPKRIYTQSTTCCKSLYTLKIYRYTNPSRCVGMGIFYAIIVVWKTLSKNIRLRRNILLKKLISKKPQKNSIKPYWASERIFDILIYLFGG